MNGYTYSSHYKLRKDYSFYLSSNYLLKTFGSKKTSPFNSTEGTSFNIVMSHVEPLLCEAKRKDFVTSNLFCQDLNIPS